MFLIIGIWGGPKEFIQHLNFSIHFAWVCFDVGCDYKYYWITGTTDIVEIINKIKIPKGASIFIMVSF